MSIKYYRLLSEKTKKAAPAMKQFVSAGKTPMKKSVGVHFKMNDSDDSNFENYYFFCKFNLSN